MPLLEYASMPAVGSSKTITLDSPVKAIATESFLFCPPEMFFVSYYLLSSMSTSFKRHRISLSNYSPSSPLNDPNNYKCSSTVRSL